jgi:hypothetical protein
MRKLLLFAFVGCATPASSTSTSTTSQPSPSSMPAPPPPRSTLPPADPSTGCPAIQLKAPDAVAAGTKARFSAVLAGGPSRVDYGWTVSTGRIVSGQGTAELLVDTTGLSGATINATVAIGGLSTTCATTTGNASVLVGTPNNE